MILYSCWYIIDACFCWNWFWCDIACWRCCLVLLVVIAICCACWLGLCLVMCGVCLVDCLINSVGYCFTVTEWLFIIWLKFILLACFVCCTWVVYCWLLLCFNVDFDCVCLLPLCCLFVLCLCFGLGFDILFWLGS